MSYREPWTYKGFTYEFVDEREPDVIKRYHYCITEDSEAISMPFSPYYRVDLESFSKWIDMGLPNYTSIGGNIISKSQLDEIYELAMERQFLNTMDEMLDHE